MPGRPHLDFSCLVQYTLYTVHCTVVMYHVENVLKLSVDKLRIARNNNAESQSHELAVKRCRVLCNSESKE